MCGCCTSKNAASAPIKLSTDWLCRMSRLHQHCVTIINTITIITIITTTTLHLQPTHSMCSPMMMKSDAVFLKGGGGLVAAVAYRTRRTMHVNQPAITRTYTRHMSHTHMRHMSHTHTRHMSHTQTHHMSASLPLLQRRHRLPKLENCARSLAVHAQALGEHLHSPRLIPERLRAI